MLAKIKILGTAIYLLDAYIPTDPEILELLIPGDPDADITNEIIEAKTHLNKAIEMCSALFSYRVVEVRRAKAENRPPNLSPQSTPPTPDKSAASQSDT